MRSQTTVGIFFCSVLCVFGATVGLAGAAPVAASTSQVAHEPTDFTASAERSVQADNRTNISVRLNGTNLPAKSERITGDDPKLAVTVSAPTTIEAVSVRIDDETRRTYFPNATAFSTSAELNTEPGEHSLKIVVESGTTTSYNTTIIKDAVPPRIQFDSPFVTGVVEDPPEEYVTRSSRVVMAGSLHDRSEIKYIEFRPKYFTGAASEEAFSTRRTVRIDDPGTQFSIPLRLIYFADRKRVTNLIQIRVEDEQGHVRTNSVNFDIIDNRRPTVDVQQVTPLYKDSAVKIEFAVRDAVGIQNVILRSGSAEMGGNTYLYRRPVDETAPAPQELTFTQRVSIEDSPKRIKVTSKDRAGNTVTHSERFDFSELIRPKIRINRSTYRSSERTLSVRGLVYNGQISSVRVETQTADGKIIDSQTVFGGGVTTEASINTTVSTSASFEAVVVRSVDVSGEEHTQQLSIADIIDANPETSNSTAQSETLTSTEETPVQTTVTSQASTTTAGTPPEAATGSVVASLLSLPVFRIIGAFLTLTVLSLYAVYKITRP